MKYVLVGLNHKTAPVSIREKIAVDKSSCRVVLPNLLSRPVLDEAAIVSTCNRVEVYGVSPDLDQAQMELKRFFADPLPESEDIQPYIYCKSGKDVVSHLFSVAASVDSMVVGENQVTGQVKEAYQLALDTEATGLYLNRLFHRALYVAKRVKTETSISQGNVSVGSVAVMLAKKIFGDLSSKSVCLLGTGEIGELVVRCLNAENVEKSYLVNRSSEKARALEDQGLGHAILRERFLHTLKEVDVLITSVSGEVSDLGLESLETLMAQRHGQPLFIIDLGVPRNVDSAVSDLDNVYLYNVDDLKEVSEQNQGQREQSVESAREIIGQEVQLFFERHLDTEAMPTISTLSQKFELIRQKELEKTLAKMPALGSEETQHIEKLSKVLMNRVLHDPILSLKNKKDHESGVVSLVRKIFRLDDE